MYAVTYRPDTQKANSTMQDLEPGNTTLVWVPARMFRPMLTVKLPVFQARKHGPSLSVQPVKLPLRAGQEPVEIWVPWAAEWLFGKGYAYLYSVDELCIVINHLEPVRMFVARVSVGPATMSSVTDGWELAAGWKRKEAV